MAIKKDFNALKLEQFPWVYEVAKDVAEGADSLSAGVDLNGADWSARD